MADRILLLAALLLAACDDEETEAVDASPACQDLCEELVDVCAYEAYPRMDTCLQGCAWEESQGVDVRKEWACIRDADCYTFTILECAHEYGLQD